MSLVSMLCARTPGPSPQLDEFRLDSIHADGGRRTEAVATQQAISAVASSSAAASPRQRGREVRAGRRERVGYSAFIVSLVWGYRMRYSHPIQIPNAHRNPANRHNAIQSPGPYTRSHGGTRSVSPLLAIAAGIGLRSLPAAIFDCSVGDSRSLAGNRQSRQRPSGRVLDLPDLRYVT